MEISWITTKISRALTLATLLGSDDFAAADALSDGGLGNDSVTRWSASALRVVGDRARDA
eukprot:CAMPEP_0117599660 /NCGR_PEP_ID=MMETSP0784-20121206/76070_1 /TAXON_ID=39447 /ORGANISM="" /LENGTH=59 /DNA_ID=CAMNT_0005402235 /DNA_START=118 /DNA_END=294 /DNA_ORIENTATION=+